MQKFSTGKNPLQCNGFFVLLPLTGWEKSGKFFGFSRGNMVVPRVEERSDAKAVMKISHKKVVDELAAIGFAKATDFLSVEDGQLLVRSTRELSKSERAAIASLETTANGIRVKFYDKMKALELLGKYLGLFDGKTEQAPRNDLLEAILAATREDVDDHDIPELQQAAAAGNDLVEPAGS